MYNAISSGSVLLALDRATGGHAADTEVLSDGLHVIGTGAIRLGRRAIAVGIEAPTMKRPQVVASASRNAAWALSVGIVRIRCCIARYRVPSLDTAHRQTPTVAA
jgi:hypothetical protein